MEFAEMRASNAEVAITAMDAQVAVNPFHNIGGFTTQLEL